MIIFWAITPLASSVFATTKIDRVRTFNATTTARLLPLESQYSALTTGFMMTAYGSVWLDQELPAFTTKEGTILPFETTSPEHFALLNKTFTTTTTMYSTSLNCKPATVANGTSGVNYSDGNGCTALLGMPLSPDATALYIGWYMTYSIDYALSGMGCSSKDFSNLFLAYFSYGPNTTVLFCKPAYWEQPVNATVIGSNMTVLEVIPHGPPEPLSDSSFNASNFEYSIGTGNVVQSQRADISDTSWDINQKARLQEIGISGNLTDGNMVGFAFGITKFEISEYLDARKLATSFEKAHQLLFALAFQTLLSPDMEATDPRIGAIRGTSSTITVVRTLALIVECFLGLATVLALALLYMAWRRTSKLYQDPASLKAILDMIESDLPASLIMNGGLAVDENLYASIERSRFRFSGCESSTKQASSVKNGQEFLGKSFARDPLPNFTTKRPLELRMPMAIVFVGILLLAVGTLVALYRQIQGNLGLALPSANAVVNQLLTNYFPVIFATLLEPFWLLLNRTLCILQPFEDLRKGGSGSSKSLDLKYTSLPPQLVGWRAVRARHLLLAAVCATGLSANVLSVALGGLFNNTTVSLGSSNTFRVQKSPIFRKVDIDPFNSDPVFVAKANVSDRISLPPWLSQDKYFIPFVPEDASGAKETAVNHVATAQGFGASLECAQVNYDPTIFITGNQAYATGIPNTTVTVPPEYSNGRNLTCINANQGPSGGQSNSRAALEVMFPLSGSISETNDLCSSLLLVGILRGNLTVAVNNFKTDNSNVPTALGPKISSVNSLSSLWMICQPSLFTSSYSVSVDSSGRVKDYSQQGSPASDFTPFFSNGTSQTLLFSQTGSFWGLSPDTQGYWHNDTFVDTWFAYFFKQLANSTAFIDPTNPVPTFDAVVPIVKDVYSRIFAIMLSLHPDWFSDAPAYTTINGKSLTTQPRIFMSRPAFVVTISLLIVNVVVAIVYYAKRPKKMLKRMPTTIASVIELFDGSGLIKEARENGGLKEEWKLGYGRFVGTDGKPRIGIDRRPFVVPWGNGPS